MVEGLSFKYEWNVNTVLAGLLIAGMFVTSVTAWNSQQNKNLIQDDWMTRAEKETSMYREQARTTHAVFDQRNADQDVRISTVTAEVDRLGDRMTSAEKSIEEMGNRFDRMIDAITQVRDTGNELNTKLEILRTILERIEGMQTSDRSEGRSSLTLKP